MSRRPLKYRLPNEEATGDQRSSAIRGPNSALTEFLREQGINAEEIRQRHLRRIAGEAEGGEGGGEAEQTDDQIREAVEQEVQQLNNEPIDEISQEELEIRIAARRKRRAAAGKDADDDYTDSEDDEYHDVGSKLPIKRKVVGEDDDCVICSKSFTITVHSKELNSRYLCETCSQRQIENEQNIKKNQLISRKKRQKLAKALLDRQDVKLPSLQDLCIKIITDNIDLVEKFGDISSINTKKISRILCRNRSLDDNSINLFLDDTSLKRIELWDCSKLSKDSYDKIVSFCPNLTDLKLLMCGKLHDDNLSYIHSNLRNLTSIELDGPFLISNDAWQSFFQSDSIKQNLKKFKISHTHRFSDETFKVLLENCGSNLTDLKLARLDGIKHKESYDILPAYLTNLESLEIEYPHHETLVDDELLINLLGVNGERLHTLVLDGCSGLTDEFLINGIRPFCINLRRLSLQFLDQITGDGFIGLFHDWRTVNFGLNEVNLRKCFSLNDDGLIELLLHSQSSLVEMSINSVKDLTIDFFQILRAPNLIYLDAGFVRSVDDEVLQLIGENCPQLKVLDCYGNNKCTSKAVIRDGLKVIGRQSDTV